MTTRLRRIAVGGAVVLALVATAPVLNVGTATARSQRQAGRYILRAKSAADLVALKADLKASGTKVEEDLSQINAVAVEVAGGAADTLATNSHVASVGKTAVRQLIQPDGSKFNPKPALSRLKAGKADPASALKGLMWNLDRIKAPQANRITYGSDAVTVAVADTGLDFTHSELAGRIAGQADLTDPTLCKDFYGYSDADMAAMFGGPAKTDWNGHGSWIGGNIAANLDGVGVNGIAPKVNLFDLKISEWCGSAYDDALISSFAYAADHGIDVVSISFGGYLDRSDPDQEAIYQAYIDVVRYARSKGTLIVAAAGNEHLRIGPGGRVISHGPLTIPGDPFDDYFGLYETPGGIPGVVDVSATGNVVVGSSATCDPADIGANAVCKPKSDAHQPTGVGQKDQLTYYSNYGPRIDIAGPGGARKFNLPNADRGGTGGFPYTDADGTTAFEDFSITSNWALEIPCFVNVGVGYPNECYSTIQGTSMATPHVSAVAGLVASAIPQVRHRPDAILAILQQGAANAHNTTPGLSATDTSPGDRTGLACPTGYCHLGGPAISDREAYGAGIVDALGALVHAGH